MFAQSSGSRHSRFSATERRNKYFASPAKPAGNINPRVRWSPFRAAPSPHRRRLNGKSTGKSPNSKSSSKRPLASRTNRSSAKFTASQRRSAAFFANLEAVAISSVPQSQATTPHRGRGNLEPIEDDCMIVDDPHEQSAIETSPTETEIPISVTIEGTKRCMDEKGEEYTSYTIKIVLRGGRLVEVERRFSSFVKLHQTLEHALKSDRALDILSSIMCLGAPRLLPNLPSKTLFANRLDPHLTDRRRLELQSYLQAAISLVETEGTGEGYAAAIGLFLDDSPVDGQ